MDDGDQKSKMIVLLKVGTLCTFLCNTKNITHCSMKHFKGPLPWENEWKSEKICYYQEGVVFSTKKYNNKGWSQKNEAAWNFEMLWVQNLEA